MKFCWQKGHALSFGALILVPFTERSAFEPGVPICSAIFCCASLSAGIYFAVGIWETSKSFVDKRKKGQRYRLATFPRFGRRKRGILESTQTFDLNIERKDFMPPR